MLFPLIDRKEVIERFTQFIEMSSPFRILFLAGGPKLGKTHLLTNIFPQIALEKQGYRSTIIDMQRQAPQDIADTLYDICSQLGGATGFPKYHLAYQEWRSPKITIQSTGMRQFFSSFVIRAHINDERRVQLPRELVPHFIDDLIQFKQSPTLLLFDAIDKAHQDVEHWLIRGLLVELARLEQVRVVVTTSALPKSVIPYKAQCDSYTLLPVHDVEEYVMYCKQVGLQWTKEYTAGFAAACLHNPGLFVEHPELLGKA